MCAAKNKHLSREDRHEIQNGLDNGHSFKQIGRDIGKDCTSISKEVRNNSTPTTKTGYNSKFNECAHRNNCEKTYICNNCPQKKDVKCKRCRLQHCNPVCSDFEKETCSLLSKPPYVCNACDQRYKCTLKKVIYDYSKAHASYETRISESHQGIVINENDITRLNDLFYPLVVEKGQSIHHVFIHHKDEIMFSEKTIYKIIDNCLLNVRNINLPRKVRRKIKRKSSRYKIDSKCREGRTYEDFLSFIEKNPEIAVVQMDSVEGVKGGKVLLTIHFVNSHLMLAFLRDYNDSKSVIDIIDKLYEKLGAETFKKMFPVILCDNGSEFSNPTAIEFDKEGQRRTYLFYCDPSAPYQKGSCEVNHGFIRRISPKGKSLDNWTQDIVNRIMSHINSYGRDDLNDKSPIDLFTMFYGTDVLNKLNLTRIHPDDINLTYRLLTNDERDK